MQTDGTLAPAASLREALRSAARRRRGTPSVPATPDRAGVPEPGWTGPAFAVLLLATAGLYLWDLGASGWANSFYSAAVQAGSESWKAFFFGSSDAANSITVDKTPLSLWPMALSVRLFGLSSWSILVPQALEGVAAVALLTHLVRRSTGSAPAGLLAGTALALTPVAALMFRFNNPDALLTLLLIGATGATLRAVADTERPHGRPVRWLALGGALVGLAFLTKMLQAFLILPALALVYLVFARTGWGRRIGHLLIAFGSMLLAGGWWVAIVQLWPAGSRPWIGGSQHNSILELTLGYNGFGRLTGDEVGSVGGGGGQAGRWGATGLGRLLGTEIGGQIAWLLPTALVLGVAAWWWARHGGSGGRRVRAAVLAWGVTLLVTAATFSFMAGIFHAYYTVALAPSIAALAGIGAWAAWEQRGRASGRLVLAGAVLLAAGTSVVLLGRVPDFHPWLRYLILTAALATATLLAFGHWLGDRALAATAAVALAAVLAGPAAYTLATVTTAHGGSLPTAGPNAGTGPGVRPGPGGPGAAGGNGGVGGLLDGSTSTTAINDLLGADSGSYTWVAAAVGSNSASGYQLATGLPVMALGGFNGSDPSPTLATFQQYVADGSIHYFIAGGGGLGGGPGGPGRANGTTTAITSWVEANFTATTVDGVTLYDLSGGAR